MREFLIALLVGVVITAGFEALSEAARQPGPPSAPAQEVDLPADSEPDGY